MLDVLDIVRYYIGMENNVMTTQKTQQEECSCCHGPTLACSRCEDVIYAPCAREDLYGDCGGSIQPWDEDAADTAKAEHTHHWSYDDNAADEARS